MFSPLRGFEEFELRVEIEWQGRKRFVVARLERLFTMQRRVVLICRFEDAPGNEQWMILHRELREPLPLHIEKPNNSLKLRRIIANAFSGREPSVARVLQLDTSPPQIALLLASSKGFWRFDWNPTTWRDRSQNVEEVAPFVLTESIEPQSQAEARELLLSAWSDESSDARFAWNWVQLTRDEKLARLSGYSGEWNELRHVMRLVLLCTPEIWERGNMWFWALHPQFASRGHLINAQNRHDNSPNVRFALWQEWLYAHFVPDFGEAILEQHICAHEFWRDAETLESVQISAPPTFHEQLEARLELREWLQDKATPEQIERLL